MGFTFTDAMIADYRTLGYAIFRGIVPASLIADLRKATARAHDLARGKGGPQAQRLQPIAQYFTDVEMAPVRRLFELPALNDAVHRVLSPRNALGGEAAIARVGVLIEPAGRPACTAWHRDLRETASVPDLAEFRQLNMDPVFFNQFNCPIYEDNCTWYVPGSHLRAFDLPGESAVGLEPKFDDAASDAERERGCVDYCRKMPGAMRAQLDAGDFLLYHPNAWHLGNYLPDRKRVTFHGFAPTPELTEWYRKWQAGPAAKRPAPASAMAAAT